MDESSSDSSKESSKESEAVSELSLPNMERKIASIEQREKDGPQMIPNHSLNVEEAV
jgi:hypothetical protein